MTLGLCECTWMVVMAALGALLAGELRDDDSSDVDVEPEVRVGVIAWKNEFQINEPVERKMGYSPRRHLEQVPIQSGV